MQNNHHNNRQLSEGLEYGDLARLVNSEIHVDEFKSKMGSDEDIVVVSFKVNGKEPANDLMAFIEKGYEWILDSDVSSGELDDGEYLVFAETERSPEAAKNIEQLVKDITNLTETDITDWHFEYRKNKKPYDITQQNLSAVVPLTPESYMAKFGETDALEAMQESARVQIKRQAPINPWTESLRVAAGLK